jgi:hypothetical protein
MKAVTETEALRAVRRALRWLRKAEKVLVRTERQERRRLKKQDARRYEDFMSSSRDER